MPNRKEAVDQLKQALGAASDIALVLNAMQPPHHEDDEVEIALGHVTRLRKRLEAMERHAQIMRALDDLDLPPQPN